MFLLSSFVSGFWVHHRMHTTGRSLQVFPEVNYSRQLTPLFTCCMRYSVRPLQVVPRRMKHRRMAEKAPTVMADPDTRQASYETMPSAETA